MKTLGEMDGDKHNEVEETSSKQQEHLLALRSTASATLAVAPPSPTLIPHLLPTAWRTSAAVAEALSLSTGRWQRSGDGIWGSGEETDIWSTEAGGRIIGHQFQSLIGERFGDAQCHR
jgi:hypothetical protein